MATSRMYQAAAAAAAGFLPAVSMAAGVPGGHAPAFGGFDPLRSMEQHTAQGKAAKAPCGAEHRVRKGGGGPS